MTSADAGPGPADAGLGPPNAGLGPANVRHPRAGELGTFLAARRARLRPADVGLADDGDRRRVPGLRRDEVARLAGLSVSYLIRLEQGQAMNVSPQVLDALAVALGLDDAERRHLYTLSEDVRHRAGRPQTVARTLDPAMRALVASFGEVPLLVLGRPGDVLFWNRAGHALRAPHLPFDSPEREEGRPNTVRMLFLDPQCRALFPDWRRKARDVTGRLRMTAAEQPDDPRVAGLVAEMTERSPEFAELWNEHEVTTLDLAEYRMRHPRIGEIDVFQHSLFVPHAPGVTLMVTVATPGSPSAEALRHLVRP
jgi:transcriptional regulator with XRE-family HTH domain